MTGLFADAGRHEDALQLARLLLLTNQPRRALHLLERNGLVLRSAEYLLLAVQCLVR
jgi:hypothetical protein